MKTTTITGIILATLLVFSLLQICGSLKDEYDSYISNGFSFDFLIKSLDMEQKDKVKQAIYQDSSVEEYGYENRFGDVILEKDKSVDCLLVSVEEGIASVKGEVKLLAGKMPSKPMELCLPDTVCERLQIPVGDKVTLLLKRHDTLEPVEFHVMGIYECFSISELDNLYNLLTVDQTKTVLEQEGYATINNGETFSVTLNKKRFMKHKVEEYQAEIVELLQLDENETSEMISNNIFKQDAWQTNILQMAAICVLVLIILFDMGILIFNSVNLSLQERIRQYTVLRCVGMDYKQLKKMLWVEIGIYGLAGIGFGELLGRLINGFIGESVLSAIAMKEIPMSDNIWIYIITCLVGLCTIIIANYVTMRKVTSMRIVEGLNRSVRYHADKKVYHSSIKMLAVRNIKRNRFKSYMIILSVVVCESILIVIMNFAGNASLKTKEDWKKKIASYEAYIDSYKVSESSEDVKEEDYYYPESVIKKEDDIDIEKYAFNDTLMVQSESREADLCLTGVYIFSDALMTRLFDEKEIGSYNAKENILIYCNDSDKSIKQLENGTTFGNGCEIKEGYVNISADHVSGEKNSMKVKVKAELENFYFDIQLREEVENPYLIMNETLAKELYGEVNYNHIAFASNVERGSIYSYLVDNYVTTTEVSVLIDFESAQAENEQQLKAFLLLAAYLVVISTFVCYSNIANTVKTNILNRRKENAILRAMGMPKKNLKKVMKKEMYYLAGSAGIISIAFASILNILVGKIIMDKVQIRIIPYVIVLVATFIATALIVDIIFTRNQTILEGLRKGEG